MKAHRFLRVAAFLFCLSILLSGCNVIGFDVEKQLIPPQNDKEQNAMQTALYKYLESHNFTLTYPNGGHYQTPFIVLNQLKENTVLTPELQSESTTSDSLSLGNWGIVFYRWDTDNAKTRIHLLKKGDNGTWETLADIAGFSEEVAEVNFSDLNGDGFPELLVGWNLYNSNDKRLAIYRIDRQLSEVAFNNAYTALLTGNMTDDTAQDLLLFTIGSGEAQVKAQLFSCMDNQLVFRGETLLDSGIKEFGSSHIAALSPTVNGAFVDCRKDADTTITELIYWDNSSLESPFSDRTTNLNTMTAREIDIACQDVDGDGVVEWPVSERLSGQEQAPHGEGLWETDWFSYDFRSGKAIREFSSIVNLMDSYMLRLRDEWVEDDITIAYDAQKHIMSFQSNDKDESCFLEVLATHSDTKIVLPEGFTYFNGVDTWRYATRINADIITPEEVQYLFIQL
mgnify:CR=1 FL=1